LLARITSPQSSRRRALEDDNLSIAFVLRRRGIFALFPGIRQDGSAVVLVPSIEFKAILRALIEAQAPDTHEAIKRELKSAASTVRVESEIISAGHIC